MNSKITLKQKMRYAFDNTMAKGTTALITWLGIISLIIIVVSAIVVIVFDIVPHEAEGANFFEAIWMSLMHTLDSGTVGGDSGWSFRAVMLVVTLGGIFVVSILIGILSSGIESKLDELRKGRSFVLEKEHTVILGWSSKIFTIISELIVANENKRRARIVILADKNKVEMEDEIRSKIEDTRTTKIICRSGSPNDMSDLHIVNPYQAKSIIVLGTEDEHSDSQVIKTILAVTNNPKRRATPYHIIAEVRDYKNWEVAKMVGKDEVELILSDELISRIMVQTCRQSGLSVVLTELMDFDGAEIYFNEEKALIGKTFATSLAAYEDSAVIGMQFANGTVKINPPMDTVIQEGDKIIAISEDDDTLVVSSQSNPDIQTHLIRSAGSVSTQPERTLILGWNNRTPFIIKELNNYVAPQSVLKIVADVDRADEAIRFSSSQLTHLKVDFQQANFTDRKVLESLDVTSYDRVILLCYENDMGVQEADAHTLIALLHLRDISQKQGKPLTIISEMLDVRNRELAEVTKADDFIVSNNLLSLLISQISENKSLMRVFEDLFNAEGSEIYLRPVSEYIDPREPVHFYTVLESAHQKNQVAIGYRIAAKSSSSVEAYGVVVNPTKSEKISFTEGDRIIVLSDN